MNSFLDKFAIPNIIGAIDCTHIAILCPSENNQMYPGHIYINRNGYSSINTQLVIIVIYSDESRYTYRYVTEILDLWWQTENSFD